MQWEGLGLQSPGYFSRSLEKQSFSPAVSFKYVTQKKNMAPGKTHVHSKHKNKLHTKRKSSSGVKKAKKSTLSNKKVIFHVIFLKELLALVNGDTSMLWFIVADKLLDAKLGGVPSDCHATQTTSNFNPFVNTRVRIVRLQRGESWCLSGLKIAGQRLGKLYPATFNSETVKLD